MEEVVFDLALDRFTVRFDPTRVSLRQIEEAVLAHGRREGLNYSVTFLPAEPFPSGEEQT